jgi:hypothetical protein
MQISKEESNKYGTVHVWHNYTTLNSVDLFSGTEHDPEVIGHLSASELAEGKPYEVVVSLFGIDLAEGESIYEMNRRELWIRQKVCIQVFVFSDEVGKLKFIEEKRY